MTTYLYCRVSTTEQNVDQQVAAMLAKYPNVDQIITEKASGKSTDVRPQFNAMSEALEAGDTVLAYDISRLGRNVVDVVSFAEDCQTKGVSLVIFTLGGTDITSPTGKMVLTVLASVAEMERTQMLEKQAIGIKRAMGEGKYKGKQQSPETIRKCAAAAKMVNENGLTKQQAAKANEIGVATLYRYLREQAVTA